MKLHRSWRRAWPLLLLVAVAVGVATALLSPAPAAPLPRPPAPVQAAPVVVGLGTRMRYETTYTPCQRTLTEEVPAPQILHGLDRTALERVYPQWTVADWRDDLIVLIRRTDELCPEYQNWRHVRLDDDEVVVYYGRRGSQLLKERTGILAQMLPLEERQWLVTGVDLAGDAAVDLFLERDH